MKTKLTSLETAAREVENGDLIGLTAINIRSECSSKKVDFVTGAGVTPENVYREGGPAFVITPKAVLR